MQRNAKKCKDSCVLRHDRSSFTNRGMELCIGAWVTNFHFYLNRLLDDVCIEPLKSEELQKTSAATLVTPTRYVVARVHAASRTHQYEPKYKNHLYTINSYEQSLYFETEREWKNQGACWVFRDVCTCSRCKSQASKKEDPTSVRSSSSARAAPGFSRLATPPERPPIQAATATGST